MMRTSYFSQSKRAEREREREREVSKRNNEEQNRGSIVNVALTILTFSLRVPTEDLGSLRRKNEEREGDEHGCSGIAHETVNKQR